MARNRARRDFLLVVLLGLAAFYLGSVFDLMDAYVAWSRAFDYVDLEEIPIGMMAFSAGSTWFLLRRWQELRDDVADRKRMEEELRDSERRLKKQSETLKTLSAQLMKANEEERRYVARELHDQVGQDLTAFIMTLQGLQRSSDAAAAAATLEEGVRLVGRMLQRVRDLSLELRPSMLDDLGLKEVLRWYLDRQRRRAGFRVHFSSDPTLERLDPNLETACFRLAQEAVTNIVRHANAEQVLVVLWITSGSLLLSVRDDGDGFDVAAARERAVKGGSLGLLGMQERVSVIGGEFDINSTPGGGTEIRVRFPIEEFSSAQCN